MLSYSAFGSSAPPGGVTSAGIIGTFVGASSTDYNKLCLRYSTAGSGMAAAAAGGGHQAGSVSAFSATGASLSVAAGRLAFAFDLRGPAVTIDTGEAQDMYAEACRF